ncbi:hypothetical protein V6N12_018650, partial [Hibiscus sabdariffa]
ESRLWRGIFNSDFKRLSNEKAERLEVPLSLEEILAAVWSYDEAKSQVFNCGEVLEDAWRVPYVVEIDIGEIKFNVDSATSVGSTDCGGVLRTSEGEVGAMFSGPVPIFVAGSAEVYAIKAMLTVFIVLVI